MKLSLSFRSLPMIRQSQTGECGLACLAMVAAHYGYKTDLTSLRRQFGDQGQGTDLSRLSDMAMDMRLNPRGLSLDLEEIHKLSLPAVMHWDFNHFVVLASVGRRKLRIHDPARGIRRVSFKELATHFTGVALELSPLTDFKAKDMSRPLRLTDLIPLTRDRLSNLSILFLLTCVSQILVLASPLYLQLVVDEVLIKQDHDLLFTLACGFMGLFLLSTLSQLLTGMTSLQLSSKISCNLSASVFHHLIRLPSSFFTQRQSGDVLSRFRSISPLQDFVSNHLSYILVNLLVLLGSSLLLLFYSPFLMGVISLFIGAYLMIRLTSVRPLRQASQESIVLEAEVESLFIETLSAVHSLRRFDALSSRESEWVNRHVGATNAGIRLEKMGLGFDMVGKILDGLGQIVVVYFGACLVIDNGITLGMLYALLAYKGHLNRAAQSVIDEIIHFRMLSLHLERLSDICLSDIEQTSPILSMEKPLSLNSPSSGSIKAVNLGYQWNRYQPALFKSLNLALEAGQALAIVGCSGSGKSTLLRLLQGQLEPTLGRITVDSIPLHGTGKRYLRQVSAAVMNDDVLVSGTLISNVTMEAVCSSPKLLKQVLAITGLHRVVAHLPMGIETPVSDLGALLSSGQIQRLLLARALYRKPRVLFLDEGTSHLHSGAEFKLMQRIRQLGITLLFTTHNRKLLQLADRVIVIRPGGNACVYSAPSRSPSRKTPKQSVESAILNPIHS